MVFIEPPKSIYIIIEQQTGMPLIIMQHMQPGIDMQVIMHSQQAAIIFIILGSLLAQVILQPISTISVLHMPIMPRLYMAICVPFIMQQTQHEPPCIIMQRFCIIAAQV